MGVGRRQAPGDGADCKHDEAPARDARAGVGGVIIAAIIVAAGAIQPNAHSHISDRQ